ncbi:hypothetical protein NE237_019082 [Protea cynaroides]|uniref:Uncharacterized protein n=1 Tax=Protea cynaroides TaxID=273540 RepID=A0A9Q0KB25_9MAGN|nr:hypothetical protein NE237_019082 [Protea cynaroides]
MEMARGRKGLHSCLVDPIIHKTQKSTGHPLSGSSAGHTPFPSRLSIMARDMRLGKVGRGASNLTKGPNLVDGPKNGPIFDSQKTYSLNTGIRPCIRTKSIWTDPAPVDKAQPSDICETYEVGIGRALDWPKTYGLEYGNTTTQMPDPLENKCLHSGHYGVDTEQKKGPPNLENELQGNEEGAGLGTGRGEEFKEDLGLARAKLFSR